MGFAFPKEQRPRPRGRRTRHVPHAGPSDERYNWVRVRSAAIEDDEMRELVEEAWRMVVPKFLAAERLDGRCPGRMLA